MMQEMIRNMVAPGGQTRPPAQVLRNSLSGHPPPTGPTRCHVVNLSSESVASIRGASKTDAPLLGYVL